MKKRAHERTVVKRAGKLKAKNEKRYKDNDDDVPGCQTKYAFTHKRLLDIRAYGTCFNAKHLQSGGVAGNKKIAKLVKYQCVCALAKIYRENMYHSSHIK